MNIKFIIALAIIAIIIIGGIIIANPGSSKEELVMVIELSRHGARSPNYIYNYTLNPNSNFNDTGELTQKGWNEHYQLGQHLRQKYIVNKTFLNPTYTKREFYIQSTFRNRNYQSALAQIQGMFPIQTQKKQSLSEQEIIDILQQDEDSKLLYYNILPMFIQLEEKQVQEESIQSTVMNLQQSDVYQINQIDQQFDMLLHLDQENCERFAQVQQYAYNSMEYQKLSAFFINKTMSRIQNLTQWGMNGEANMTEEDLRQVCSYILWALDANITLKFNATEQDLISCSQLGDTKFYGVSYGISDLWYLGASEFLNQLHELCLHYVDNSMQELMQYFYKYYKPIEIANYPNSVGAKEPPPLPKFIHYSSNAENIAKVYEALGFHRVQRIRPSAALFIEISKEKSEYYVRLFHIDNDKTETPIKFQGQHKDKVQMSHFQKFLEVRLKEIGFKKHLESECTIPYTPQMVNYFSGEEAISEILEAYRIHNATEDEEEQIDYE